MVCTSMTGDVISTGMPAMAMAVRWRRRIVAVDTRREGGGRMCYSESLAYQHSRELPEVGASNLQSAERASRSGQPGASATGSREWRWRGEGREEVVEKGGIPALVGSQGSSVVESSRGSTNNAWSPRELQPSTREPARIRFVFPFRTALLSSFPSSFLCTVPHSSSNSTVAFLTTVIEISTIYPARHSQPVA